MKKILIATAVAGVFAGSAVAANVSMYGVLDTGFNATKTSYSGTMSSIDSVSTFAMQSGQHNGNRLGLKGSEDLGNGLTVSFKLENGYSSDTGALGQGGRLFGREARLTLGHECGAEVSFGRMGAISSNAGTYGNFWNYGDALGGGWGGTVGALNTAYAQVGGRFDNAIVVKTPNMAGLTGYIQYSLGNGTEKAQSSQNDRYAALGVTYDNGPLGLGAVAETYKPVDKTIGDLPNTNPINDAYNVNLGASYDFDVVKVFAAYQYSRYARSTVANDAFTPAFKADFSSDKNTEIWSMNSILAAAGGCKGHTLTLSAAAPVAGGTLYAGYTYGIQKSEADVAGAATKSNPELTTNNLYVAFDYALSKRTTVYTGAAFTQFKVEKYLDKEWTAKVLEAQVGLVHKF